MKDFLKIRNLINQIKSTVGSRYTDPDNETPRKGLVIRIFFRIHFEIPYNETLSL